MIVYLFDIPDVLFVVVAVLLHIFSQSSNIARERMQREKLPCRYDIEKKE